MRIRPRKKKKKKIFEKQRDKLLSNLEHEMEPGIVERLLTPGTVIAFILLNHYSVP